MKFYVSGYSDDVVSWRAGRKQEELSTADASFVIEVPPTTLLRLSVTYGNVRADTTQGSCSAPGLPGGRR